MKPYLSHPFALLFTACLPGAINLMPQALATPRFETVQAIELGAYGPDGKLVKDSAGNLYGSAYGGAYGEGTLYKITPDGTIATLHHFNGREGGLPGYTLTLGNDGNLYGICHRFGDFGNGAIFRITPEGEDYTVIHEFSGGADGTNPRSQLLLGTDGNFYGATSEGGANGLGTFYRLTPGGVFTTLVNWAEDSVGWDPYGNIVQAADGNFYGTHRFDNYSQYGEAGTVYRVTPAGVATAVANFGSLPSMNFCWPNGLMQASDGNFYGATRNGGAHHEGTIFKVTPGGTLTLLKEFARTDGSDPDGVLTEGTDGDLYSSTASGGVDGWGTLFKVSKAGAFTTLVDLEVNLTGPSGAQRGLIADGAGSFLGTSGGGGTYGRGTVFRMDATGNLDVLAHFNGDPDKFPNSKLLQASDGSIYGTTSYGGMSGSAIFKLTPDGNLSTLFESEQMFEIECPELAEGSDGNIYGTFSSSGEFGTGSVFKMTPSGDLTHLTYFDDVTGYNPNGLTRGADGNFYGTTNSGTSTYAGSIFKVDESGDLDILAAFDPEGLNNPAPGSFLASDGNVYGTLKYGGESYGGGIFKLTPDGILSNLVEFDGVDTRLVEAGLMEASDGNFYGVSTYGGPEDAGSVFKVTPDGTLTTLAFFDLANGATPVGALTEGPDGALYGVTTYGGENIEEGTVFRITKEGALSTVLHFNRENGRMPLAGLSKGIDGNLYGTASEGGTTLDGKPAGGGVIFCIRFGADVETIAASAVDAASATLNANVNPSGYATDVSFHYGTSPTLDSYSTLAAGSLAAGDATLPVQASLTGLAPSTTYYFRVVANNAETPMTQAGEIFSFTTEAGGTADIAVEAGGQSLSDGGFALAGIAKVGNSVDLTLTIRNTSSGTALTDISAALSGAGASHYSIQTAPASTVTGGGTTTCVIRFSPNSTGIKTAKLKITSNDPDESPFDINLGGIALPANFPW